MDSSVGQKLVLIKGQQELGVGPGSLGRPWFGSVGPIMKSSFPVLVLLLLLPYVVGSAPAVVGEPESLEQSPLTVYLVRHAEKMSDSRDPALSGAGRARAETLARVLKDTAVRHVHSSDYTRTRDTAGPVAKSHGLQVRLYDPSDLPSIAASLLSAGGRHLVVGHSNTTPALVGLLGGAPGEPIEEKSEYDRLYVITVGGDGKAQTTLLRYGAPATPEPAGGSKP